MPVWVFSLPSEFVLEWLFSLSTGNLLNLLQTAVDSSNKFWIRSIWTQQQSVKIIQANIVLWEQSWKKIPAPGNAVIQFHSASLVERASLQACFFIWLLNLGLGLSVPSYCAPKFKILFLTPENNQQPYADIKSEAAFSHLKRFPMLKVFPVALCSAKHVFSRCCFSNHVFKSVVSSISFLACRLFM